MVKIDFEVETKYGMFRDALYVEETVSAEEIEAMKQARVNNWIYVIEHPPVEEPVAEEPVAEEPVAEEPVAEDIQINGVTYRQVEIDGQVYLQAVGV